MVAVGQPFPTTKWSLVLAARTGSSPRSRAAVASLCESYWGPLYAYLRHRGYSVDEARDLTQSYFLLFLEKDYLKDVKPEIGKFRTFLLASFKHFLANERDKALASKRGGDRSPITLDTAIAERRYRVGLEQGLTPDQVYERRWALGVLEEVLARLRKEFETAGKRSQFETLRACLTGEAPRRPYREMATALEMSEAAVKVAVHRLRQRYGQLLREEIAQTVADPGEVDGEIRHLLASCRS
jgi:RNA polymerase sigma-70 factor (ECF subfamily)